MSKIQIWVVTLTVLLLTGCMAPVGRTVLVSLPSDARKRCEAHCKEIGMTLGAVAIMANNVGCICQASAGSGAASSAVAGGMATIMLQQEQRRRQQQAR